MSVQEWYAALGAVLFVGGLARMFAARDLVARLVALNICGAGSLLLVVTVGAGTAIPDPVPHALALTGIVITVAVTAVGLALARRLEDDDRPDQGGGS